MNDRSDVAERRLIHFVDRNFDFSTYYPYRLTRMRIHSPVIYPKKDMSLFEKCLYKKIESFRGMNKIHIVQ